MLRFVSLVGLAVLTLAAVAVTANSRLAAKEHPRDDNRLDTDSENHLPRAVPSVLSFHAPFSLN
jgi:hypothetical protein